MQQNIPTINSRGYKTVMGFIEDAAEEMTLSINFATDEARAGWIKTNYEKIVKRGQLMFRNEARKLLARILGGQVPQPTMNRN